MEEFLQSFIDFIKGIIAAIEALVSGFRDLNDGGGKKEKETTEADG